MNFVYTDEHKKRRLNELDDNKGELPVLLSNNSYSFTDGHKEELIEYYNQAGFKKSPRLCLYTIFTTTGL